MLLSRKFREAVEYALELHAHQQRKGTGVPYTAHLFSVAGLALEYGATEIEAMAALLHDAVEDQGGPPTLAVIRERFGREVADIVQGCSDTDVSPKPPWRDRKEQYIHSLRDAPRSVLLVTACDKLHNAQSIRRDYAVLRGELWNRFAGKREGTIWYYRAVSDALVSRSSELPGELLAELGRTVRDLELLPA